MWELAFQPGSSGTANLGPVLMQEADVLPLSLTLVLENVNETPNQVSMSICLVFSSDYCFSKLNFESLGGNVLSNTIGSEWREWREQLGLEDPPGTMLLPSLMQGCWL